MVEEKKGRMFQKKSQNITGEKAAEERRLLSSHRDFLRTVTV